MLKFVVIMFGYAVLPSCVSKIDTGSSATSNEEPSQEEIPTSVTFYEDLQPIINRACIFCHSNNGRSFSMVEPDLVVLFADIIARDV